MKRAFTLFCALMLLLSCFSGMAVSAAEVEETDIIAEAPAEEIAEVPAEETAKEELVRVEGVEIELFPDLRKDETKQKVTGAALEHELSASFMKYLKQEFAKCPSQINIEKYNINVNQWSNFTSVIWYETPELFHVISLSYDYYPSSGTVANIYPGYRTHADTAAEYKTCLDKMVTNAERLLRGVKDNTALSDVEKALILHDRLAVWTEYDLGNVNSATVDHKIFAAYSALGEGLSVCQGYAMAYMYLLEQVGIESDLCSSSALWHAWNIVYIDGEPYYTDVTWDDPTNNWPTKQFYDDYGRVYHVNFLRSYEGIHSNHTASDYPQVNAPTTYDSGWWRDSETAIVLVSDDQLYYRSKNDGHVYQYDNGNTWVEAYTDGYKGQLAVNGKTLLYNNRKEVFSVDTDNGSNNPLWAPSSIQNTGGYIEGLKYEKGKIFVQLNDGYGYSWREEMAYAEQGTPLKIVTQPKNTVAANGSTAKFAIKATGDGLKYTWYIAPNGGSYVPVTNQTTNVLKVKMAPKWHGAKVRCYVTDMYGNVVKSNVATLYMGNFAKIISQPTNGVAPNGKVAKIAVKATGDGLRYTWYIAKKGGSWVKVTSQTTNVLSVTMSAAWHGGRAICVITDSYGNQVKSKEVALYMATPVKFTAQPKNGVAPNGKTAKVTVKASGKNVKYAWYIAKRGTSTFTKVASQTGSTFSLKMSSAWHGAKVYCVATDAYGAIAKSSTVTLYMGNPATIKTQPANTAVKKNATAKVTVKASGDGLKYQWYYASKGSSSFKKLSGQTKATYSVKMSSAVNGRKVYCVVKDKYGNSVKSDVATLHMGTAVKIKTQPKDTTAFSGKTAKVTVKATGSGLKYQWYYASKGSSSFKKLSGATKATYSVKMSSSVNGRKVYCVVTDKYGVSVKSTVVVLKMAQKAKITTQPKNVTGMKGETVKVSVKATGDGLKYQWYYAKKGSSSFKKISGATKASYSIKMTSSVNGRKVYCKVTDQYGNSVKSKTATLKLNSFDPLKSITGNWYSYSAYSIYSGSSTFYSATMTISSDYTARIRISSNSMFTTGTFTYDFYHEETSGDYAYYYLYNNAGELTGIYDISAKTMKIRLNNGSYIMFER